MTVSRFRYLFNRYYAGQCTPEEQQELMLLLEQSAHDEELREALDELLLEATDDTDLMPDDTAANMLQQIMQTSPARVRRIPVWKRAAIAASVLAAVALAGYKLYHKSTVTDMPIAVNHAPAPETNTPGWYAAMARSLTWKNITTKP